MSLYYCMSKVYQNVKNIPVVGSVCKKISPSIKKIFLKRYDKNIINEGLDLLAQSVFEMKISFKQELDEQRHSFQKEIKASKSEVSCSYENLENKLNYQDTRINEYFTIQNGRLEDYMQQVQAFKDRVEFIRLELMEMIKTQTNEIYKEGKKPAVIKEQDRFHEISMSGQLSLNLGCGHKPLDGYLNIDKRDLPNVDVVAEVDNLPFDFGSVQEIYAAHLVEHFTMLDLETKIFPYWHSLLKENGILKIVVPDAVSMMIDFNSGQMTFNDLKEVIFGAQDYDDDFHFSMFSPDGLKKSLMAAGFKFVEIKERSRKNGKCREMEIWGRKF